MKINMGMADRIIRVIIAATVGVLYYTGIISGTLGAVLIVLASVFLLTSIVKVCPIYSVLGIKSCKVAK
jgi:hypothetical protein